VRSPADDRIVGWTTNRNQFLFSSNRGGTNGLWALPFSKQGAAGEPRELKSDMEGMQPLGLTSSGSLFYSVIRPDINVWTAEIDVEAARTISGPRRASLKFRGVQNYASWSHDGSKLAVCLLGSLAVWSRDKDEVHSLEVKGIFFSSPQWLGTSGWLMAFGSNANGKQGYYRINSANGEAQLAFDSSAINSNGFAGVWTHDGTIHFNRYSGGQSGLFRLNVVTGERRSLYVPPSGSNLGREALALSPDERWLAFQLFHTDSKISNLMLIPSEGGEARTLWNIDGAYFFSNGAFTWSRDGHYVIAARERNRISEIWRIPLDGSAPRKVEFPDTKRLMTLRMDPDGKTIAFVAGDLPKPELWVLENFLAR
jgi:Tol biopolymer transport system component